MSVRALVVVIFLATGCSFTVAGRPEQPPSGPVTPGGVPQLPTPAAIDGGVTTAAPDLAPVVIGGGCTSDADCGSGGLCLSSANGVAFPGGYCTIVCSQDGGKNAVACPTGSACIDNGDASYCLAACPPAACRSGYICCKGQPVCAPASACQD